MYAISNFRRKLFADIRTTFHFVRSIPTVKYSVASFEWINAFTGRCTSELGATACTVCNRNKSFFLKLYRFCLALIYT